MDATDGAWTEPAPEERGAARSSGSPSLSLRYLLPRLKIPTGNAVERGERESRRRGEHVRRQLKLQPTRLPPSEWDALTYIIV
uniref:Uncharacterized protein n=1 Tax=Arundo donax TaxID=35708 RepID=A0A0A8YUF2_ARUDO